LAVNKIDPVALSFFTLSHANLASLPYFLGDFLLGHCIYFRTYIKAKAKFSLMLLTLMSNHFPTLAVYLQLRCGFVACLFAFVLAHCPAPRSRPRSQFLSQTRSRPSTHNSLLNTSTNDRRRATFDMSPEL